MPWRIRQTACAAFVLAGGKSTRMGADKAFLMLHGRTLVQRAIDAARTLTQDVSIVGSAFKFQGLAPVIEDIFPDCGPLGGIHAALRSSKRDLNLVLAVDVPFAPAHLMRYLLREAENNSEASAVVPLIDQHWQPLCAVYRRDFADVAEIALRQGNYKIDALFCEIKVMPIEARKLAELGFSAEVFSNLNTQEDLARAGGKFGEHESISGASQQ
ncbi:MAG TPA: molybdenum cofactor guanylyltransferase [Candidatus Sulfotelmatobacter sp.]